jgi:hypothetical protein
MQPRIRMEEHTPRARCYECGSPEVIGLCHHCGSAMCADHRPVVLSASGRTVTREFAGLGVNGDRAAVYHCDAHEHVVKGDLNGLMGIGILMTAVGAVVAAWASVVPGLLLLVGIPVAVGAFLITRRRKAAAKAARPSLALIPDRVSVQVTETLRGKIRMNDQDAYEYASEPEPVRGQIDVTMDFADPALELQSYRDRYRLAGAEDIQFSAGYAVVLGPRDASKGAGDLALVLESGPAAIPLHTGTGIAFTGPVASHPLFGADGDRSVRWTARARYGLLPVREPTTVPLWLVPSLLPDSSHRTLELDLQWATISNDGKTLDLGQFELIELNVPAVWGKVVDRSEGAKVSGPVTLAGSGELVRIIQWKRPKKERGQPRRSLTLAVTFEHEIRLHRENDNATCEYHKLTGKIRASFTGAFSGINDVAIYCAPGDRWKNSRGVKVDIKTEVSVDFDLSLRFVRYQDIWVIPDSAADGRRAEPPEYSVIPDYETVIGLTNELSASRYYVKRVIENPPSSGRRANLVNRFWDIAGYYYDRVFPIDFHVIVTGEEEYRSGIRAHAGSTKAQILVQGSYVEFDVVNHDGQGDPDMKGQIERRWEALSELVAKTLNAMPQVARPYAPPQDSGWAYQTAAEPPAPKAEEGRAAGAARLHEQQARIREMFIDGLITEQRYLQLKADIDAELGRG